MKDDEQLTAFRKLRSLAAADPDNFIFKAFAVSRIEEKMFDLKDFLIDRDIIEDIDPSDLLRSIIASDSELADFKYFLSQLLSEKSVFEIVVEGEIFGRNPRKQFQDLVQYLFDYEYMGLYCFPRFAQQFFFIKKDSRKVRYFIDALFTAPADDDDVRTLQKIVSAAAQKLTLEEFFEIRELLKTA